LPGAVSEYDENAFEQKDRKRKIGLQGTKPLETLPGSHIGRKVTLNLLKKRRVWLGGGSGLSRKISG